MTKSISIEKKYQKKTLKEHIETRPGNYIGTIELCTQNLWVLNDDNSKMIQKNITYSPGLMKIIDEIIVNAYDQSVRLLSSTSKRDKKVTEIDICYNKETGEISVYNNGNGIDVAIHPEHNVYVPELIFGHLLTSTNYDDEEEKITGGKNGYGAKLSNIFSKYFEIETVDYVRHMKFKQVYRDNMNKKDKSVVTKTRDQPYTKITFIPDFERFDLENITDDIERLIIKRVYDLAACTNKAVIVKLNNEKLNCQTFEKYVNLYIGNEVVRVYEKINDRWEVAACMSLDDKFEQISFVNGINTTLGGKHVDYVAGNISKQLVEYINTKKKKLNVKSAYIKENLWVFINSTIVNPDFDSQTKTNLTTNITKFGSKCIINDKFIEKLGKCGIMDRAIALAEYKENNTLKQNDGTKRSTIRGIPKLDDANYAGTTKSKDCTLILTEGDSAKAFAVAGLSVIGRNYYGVFPLKGKILNVRDCIPAKILSNQEITYLKQIIGLRQNKEYTDTNGLRYGHIMILTDADVDGSHIKGLFMNMIEHFWPSLIQITGFIQSMVTPVVKVKKGKNITSFYTLTEYNDWKNETNNGKGYDIKYYKGLGTSTSTEAKEYFGDLKNNQVDYIWEDNSKESILLAFSKNCINKRKDWLQTYNKNDIVEATERTVEYSKFIHNDLKHFSNYDNIRSIPSVIDGLKPSQRKVLYSGLLKNLINEIKVAQFAGYVSEKSSYHHGEMSLTGAIVGMAQNFVGSNNINLFNPNGMFGCVDKKTPILMWDSSIKLAETIKIGDKLIGDDGTCRIVSKLTSGIDEMYEISNGNMENYIVNSQHILTLCYSGHKSIFWKKSSKSWNMTYFDNETKTVKSKNIRTNESTNGDHYNKSIISKSDAYNKILKFAETIPDENIVDINVQQYLKLPKYAKDHMKGIMNSQIVEWDEKPLDIDPYILGLWLGDGMSDCRAFSSMDHEVIKSWCIWLDKIGCEVCHCKNVPPHECHIFYIRRRGSSKNGYVSIGDKLHSSKTCNGCKTSKHISKACDWIFEKEKANFECNGYNINGTKVVNLNPCRELFKKNKLFQNKHIPKDYILNSKENRLKILAGMIDTDGTLRTQISKKNKHITYRYEIAQSVERRHLIESFRIIAGSLGFKVKVYKTNKEILTLSITGNDLFKIPVKIERKKIKERVSLNRNPYVHNIKINSIGKGEFCGWSIDKNERFLLGDFTITHNSRLEGGKDASSPRYIFTNLNALTLLLFNKKDEALLNYLNDDGTKIEPEWYVPIIPQILVNGSEGIGTGYSTYVPKYNPKELIQSIKNLLNGKVINDLDPWYQNFKGTIIKVDDETYVSKGKYQIINSKTVEITELPVGIWTSNYKDFLDTVTVDATDKTNKKKYLFNWKYGDNYTEASVHFILTFTGMELTELISDLDKFEKTFKLQSRIKISNMHLYNRNNEIQKYKNTIEIIEEFYDIRLEYYSKRREYLITQLKDELKILNIKVQFINDVINEKIIIFKKKHAEIIEQLKQNKYPIIKNEEGYDYLIKMQIYLFTEEKVNELKKQRDLKQIELNELTNKTEKDLWLADLEEFETKYNIFVKKQVIKPNVVKGKGKKRLVVKKNDVGTSKKTIVGKKIKVIKK